MERREYPAQPGRLIQGASTSAQSKKRTTKFLEFHETPHAPMKMTGEQDTPMMSSGGYHGQPKMNYESAAAEVVKTQKIFNSLLQKHIAKGSVRPDISVAQEMADHGQRAFSGRKFIGEHPGIRPGCTFKYRCEMDVLRLHAQARSGIDFIKKSDSPFGKPVAVSVVASGGYNDVDYGDTIYYAGSGGNLGTSGKGQPEDQKLERGNLALLNSWKLRIPVRVIKGRHEGDEMIYKYEGLYDVTQCEESKVAGKTSYFFTLVKRRSDSSAKLK